MQARTDPSLTEMKALRMSGALGFRLLRCGAADVRLRLAFLTASYRLASIAAVMDFLVVEVVRHDTIPPAF